MSKNLDRSYEGLLEYQAVFPGAWASGPQAGETPALPEFVFAQGDQRAATGSHYTPDELVQPLIKHSLDYLIAEKLKEADPKQALLSLRVADIACGSGHILLAAARRIATELAIVSWFPSWSLGTSLCRVGSVFLPAKIPESQR